jgi:hypothetical protein
VDLVSFISLKTVHKIFIDKMPNDLDRYISAEITEQINGWLVVVVVKADADAIMRGVSEERARTGSMVTGRYLGLHDTAKAVHSLCTSLYL